MSNDKIVHVSTSEARTFDDAKRIAAEQGGRLPNADDYAKEALARWNRMKKGRAPEKDESDGMKHGKRSV